MKATVAAVALTLAVGLAWVGVRYMGDDWGCDPGLWDET